ncbi:MAG: MFS transporter [archaeon]
MEQKNNLDEKLKKKSLDYSIRDGAAYAVMDSAGNGYISPCAIALGANNYFIGFISSVPGLVSSILQIKTPRLMEKSSRKSIVTSAALVQAFMWLPLALIALVNIRFQYVLPSLLLSYVLLISLNALIAPSWASWMKDLVPEKESGKFFGRRNRINGILGLVAMLIAGLLLDSFKTSRQLFLGFATLFLVAFIARLISRHYLLKKYEPRLSLGKKYYFSFLQFFKKMPYNNFGRFALFIGLFQLVVNIASPFFTAYMLKDLNFTYAMFTIITTLQVLATLVSMPMWGKFADKYGNVKVMKITSLLIPILPFLWLFSPNFYYLAFVQLLAGFFWAGFNLAASNFIYDAVTRERMGLCVAYSNVINTSGVFIGANLGGFLSTNIIWGFNPFFALFMISAIGRFLVPLIMLPRITEVRDVKHFNARQGIKNQIDSIMRILNPFRES